MKTTPLKALAFARFVL
jgi:hypothetical protein